MSGIMILSSFFAQHFIFEWTIRYYIMCVILPRSVIQCILASFQGTSENNASCVCPDGFYGQHCEYNKHYCKDTNCANAGTCVEEANGARCLCVEGFEGNYCESEIDECRSNPCKNGKPFKYLQGMSCTWLIILTNLLTSNRFLHHFINKSWVSTKMKANRQLFFMPRLNN